MQVPNGLRAEQQNWWGEKTKNKRATTSVAAADVTDRRNMKYQSSCNDDILLARGFNLDVGHWLLSTSVGRRHCQTDRQGYYYLFSLVKKKQQKHKIIKRGEREEVFRLKTIIIH